MIRKKNQQIKQKGQQKRNKEKANKKILDRILEHLNVE